MNLPVPVSRLVHSLVFGLRTWLRPVTAPRREPQPVFFAICHPPNVDRGTSTPLTRGHQRINSKNPRSRSLACQLPGRGVANGVTLQTSSGTLRVPKGQGARMTDVEDIDGVIDRFYKAVGRRVRDARGDRMTQSQLAAQVGLTRSSIANLEAGRQRIQLHLLVWIAETLGVDAPSLLPGKLSFADATTIPELTELESVP